MINILNHREIGLISQATYLVIKMLSHSVDLDNIALFVEADDKAKNLAKELVNWIEIKEKSHIVDLPSVKRDTYIYRIQEVASQIIKHELKRDKPAIELLLATVRSIEIPLS